MILHQKYIFPALAISAKGLLKGGRCFFIGVDKSCGSIELIQMAKGEAVAGLAVDPFCAVCKQQAA